MLEATTTAFVTGTIATAISGIPELITDGEHGLLVPERDAPALAAAILRMIRNPDAAAAMAARGCAKVVAEFDLVRNAGRQLQMFRGQES